MKIGYGCIPRDGKSETEVASRLEALGAEKVFVDGKGRAWRDDPMFTGGAIREGDTVILLSAESLVDEEFDMDDNPRSYRRMKAQFRKHLKPIAALGVPVAVGDGDPVLYDTNDAVDGFIDMAVKERHRRKSSDGGSGEKRKPGRPVKYFATDEQKKTICMMWWDKAIDREVVRNAATEMVGWKVTDNAIKAWCGAKREKPDG